jgi:glycosyltransferase involved in cell wall biosynthesis
MRFHALGLPHTATSHQHCSCAYTAKVLKLCGMLTKLGHHVIHYGNERSEVDAAEHVSVTTHDDLIFQYGERWKTDSYTFDIADPVYRKFFANSILEIGKRKQPSDTLLCMWGAGHKPVADAHPDLIAIEPGIGYAGGHFARFKVFESYAILHAYLGMNAVGNAVMNDHWYDVVIPNFFDPNDFEYSDIKDGYLLFLGRVGDGKGLYIACQVAEKAGKQLIIAGPGHRRDIPDPFKDSFVGFAHYELRKQLLAHATALIAPSMFVEPFCGVTVEAMMSGTPVITTDWGAATENVLHGITGYRCRTFEQFVWAAKNIENIDNSACRNWAMNFATDRIAPMYEEYFKCIMSLHTAEGWYSPNPNRTDLDWMRRKYPWQTLPR